MTKHKIATLVFAVVGITLVSTWGFGQESPPVPPSPSRAGEIHEACEAEGLSIVSVCRTSADSYSIQCAPGTSDQAATAVMQRVLATEAPGQTSVTTLQDALVVLRFEPNNKQANDLVRARYAALRTAHLNRNR